MKLNPLADKLYHENNKVFLKLFDTSPEAILLDLGCNRGDLSLRVASKIGTSQIYGVELDSVKAEIAKERGLKVKSFDLNFAWLYENENFDVVSANQILEHLWNTDNFFKEINRVLKPGGYATISTPNLCSFHNLFFMFLGQQPPSVQLIDTVVGNFMRGTKVDSMHFKAFNIPALRDLANHYGFKVEKIATSGFYFWPVKVQRLFAKVLGRYAIYITIKLRKPQS